MSIRRDALQMPTSPHCSNLEDFSMCRMHFCTTFAISSPLVCPESCSNPRSSAFGPWTLLFQDNTRLSFGARAAGAHYCLFRVWTLVPVRLDKQWFGHTTVDEIASEAVDCRLTYTMVNCLQRR
ncbi:hypothetical protein TNCV_4227421 [Trichonephila clavipes]|nr:hypothetical protein TNCV_4227421 [Trichonephila clavipes]